MLYRYLFIFIIVVFYSCSNEESNPAVEMEVMENPPEDIFYKGMDLSFQSELESYNIDYKDGSGNSINVLDFVENNGTNLVRLRIWHTPQNGQNGLADVKAYAQQIKDKGMAFLLDFHYSDFWADPGTQTPPSAWQGMSNSEIREAIYAYTKMVLQELKNQNTLPEIVQIGNETDSGFLWNYGRVWDGFSDNWVSYAALVNEAIRAVREVDSTNETKVMLHIANIEVAPFFFDELLPFNIDFDIIGLSYYPQFHTKNLSLFQNTLNGLATTFNKDIMMVEVAYPFTFDWNDNQNNFIGSADQILSEFSATPSGQKDYLQWLTETIKAIPNNKGIGFCYWAPDWVAFTGNENTSTNGSVWENQCLFDFELKALPAFDVFRDN